MVDIPKYLKAPTPGAPDILAKLAGLQEEEDLADSELAKAEALRTSPQAQGLGVGGGIAAGAANFLNGLQSAIRDRRGMDAKRELGPRLAAGRQSLFDFMARRPESQMNFVGLPGQQLTQPQPPTSTGPFGFGGGF